MQFLVGFLLVSLAVVGSYMAMGGKLAVLWQPFEFTLIGGAGVGAYIFGNSKKTVKDTFKTIKKGAKGSKYKKDDYLELLTLMYQVFKLIKTKGILAIEQHVEKPDESTLFQQFPKFHSDHHSVEFFCDYLRLWTLGTDNVHQLEDLIDQELEVHHEETGKVPAAIVNLSDAFPAIGIVAAVLGVIKTMGSINEPPAVLGKLIGAALVGTFFGILLSYGYVGPLGKSLTETAEMDGKYFSCIKAALIAHMNGYAPAISVEFARKTIPDFIRPTFYEVEEAVNNLQPPV